MIIRRSRRRCADRGTREKLLTSPTGHKLENGSRVLIRDAGVNRSPLARSQRVRDLNEKVLDWKMLPTFSVIRIDKHLYGFRGVNEVWLDGPLGMQERVKRIQTTDYGAVFITNERLIGFASLLGDFSSKILGLHERIVWLETVQGLVLVTTSSAHSAAA